MGGYCAPNSESARNKLIDNLNLQEKWTFLNTYDVIRFSLLIALMVGILWMVIVHCLPKFAAIWAIFLGSITLIAAGVILLIDNAQGWNGGDIWRIVIGSILIVFGVIFFAMLCIYKRRIKITGVFLDYATKFLGKHPINFIYIPIFILLLAGLIILCLFQYLAFSSQAEPEAKDSDIYLQLSRNPVLTILTII